jgi:bacterial/archaeal transporter family-2 protein
LTLVKLQGGVPVESIAIPFLLFVGSLLALQGAANVQLAGAVGSPFGASALQLAVGAAALLAAAVAAGALGAFELVGQAPAWHLVGGIGSAVYITAGILLFPRLGALVSVGLFIAGQMAASLLLDGFGWLGVEGEGVGLAAGLGAAAVVVGAGLIVRAQAGERAFAGARGRAGWALLGLLGGAVLPVQGAINAQLRADLDAPVAVGALSFVVATVAMATLLGLLLALAAIPRPRPSGLATLPWWGWLGGLCGAIYVVSVFALIPEIGVAATVALTVAGQQLASVMVDRHGLLRLPRLEISARRLTGVGVLMVGVGLIQLG